MDRRRFLTRGLAACAALTLPAAFADPRELNVGVDACPYCNMPVIDGRFAAQGVSEGGRVLTYDAIECLLDHEAGHGPPPPALRERWLSDRVASGRTSVAWLAADAAVLLHHPRLRTPMGGGLAAFATASEAQTFGASNRLSDAAILDWSEATALAAQRPWVPPW
ncbi:MAG: hypothetical protein U5J97_02930 [Trueperaceae bacterium]|nr:hypothetical protein [Trueperaceae bacterium]